MKKIMAAVTGLCFALASVATHAQDTTKKQKQKNKNKSEHHNMHDKTWQDTIIRDNKNNDLYRNEEERNRKIMDRDHQVPPDPPQRSGQFYDSINKNPR
jgi:Ni/Co efflux regulator RcnB